MKGVILAGGKGSRLKPLTDITNKHLLPVYDRPMIEYPLRTLVRAGIRELLVVSGREHAGDFVNYLGSGRNRGLSFSYKVQEEAGGIAQAIGLAAEFLEGEKKFAVILGDNVFEHDFKKEFRVFEFGGQEAMIFTKEVDHPERFGVAVRDSRRNRLRIFEKPAVPVGNRAVVGLYLYNTSVFEAVHKLKPSRRGELEVTDVNNWYLKKGRCGVRPVPGFWSDAGSFDSMLAAAAWAKEARLPAVKNKATI